jgi:hypothetical protein
LPAAAIVGLLFRDITALLFLVSFQISLESLAFSLGFRHMSLKNVQTLYTSLIDRTIIVLWRAVVLQSRRNSNPGLLEMFIWGLNIKNILLTGQIHSAY